eukprot:6186635-Pleurochrysis_carterae.AAC.1
MRAAIVATERSVHRHIFRSKTVTYHNTSSPLLSITITATITTTTTTTVAAATAAPVFVRSDDPLTQTVLVLALCGENNLPVLLWVLVACAQRGGGMDEGKRARERGGGGAREREVGRGRKSERG